MYSSRFLFLSDLSVDSISWQRDLNFLSKMPRRIFFVLEVCWIFQNLFGQTAQQMRHSECQCSV